MTPAYQLIAGGADVTATVARRLLALTLTDEDGLSGDKLSLEIDDRDGQVAFPETDVEIAVSLGFKETGLWPMGRFVVDRVKGARPPQKLSIDCTAANMTSGLRAPRTRAWSETTLADIVRTIAAEVGLEPSVGASIADTAYAFEAQNGESDLNFLMRLARPLDATAKPAGGRLVVVKRDEGVTAEGQPVTAVAMSSQDLSSWSWELKEREAYSSVTAEWGDIDGGETREVRAGSGKPERALRHVFATEAEAFRAAEAELAMADRARLLFSGDCRTFQPELFAGGKVAISGVRSELDGEYLISRVTHSLSGALTTSFSGKRARQ